MAPTQAIHKQLVWLIASGDLRSAVETALSHKGSPDILLANLWSDMKTLTMLHLEYVSSNQNLQHVWTPTPAPLPPRASHVFGAHISM